MLLALTVLALARPIIGYDAWWYHLPFSSYLWSIGGGRSGFAIDPFLEQRWLGFPKLWEFIQGFFWYATEWLNAVIIPHRGIHLTGLEHMLNGWSDLSPASTTLSPLGNCGLGSRLMRTASTTWNG
jgi:hypothetical protein